MADIFHTIEMDTHCHHNNAVKTTSLSLLSPYYCVILLRLYTINDVMKKKLSWITFGWMYTHCENNYHTLKVYRKILVLVLLIYLSYLIYFLTNCPLYISGWFYLLVVSGQWPDNPFGFVIQGNSLKNWLSLFFFSMAAKFEL